jgi:hypothetical protein
MKRKGIRAINQGTRYDITGQLRLLARKIESGEYGRVRHLVVGVAALIGEDNIVTTLAFGPPSVPETAYTIAMMAKRTVTGD